MNTDCYLVTVGKLQVYRNIYYMLKMLKLNAPHFIKMQTGDTMGSKAIPKHAVKNL